MVSVLLIWIFMIITCYLTGFAVLQILAEGQDYRIKRHNSYWYAGIVCVTLYAEVFSLFYKVGAAALGLLAMLCLILGGVYHKKITRHIRSLFLSVTPVQAGVIALLFLLFAYGTSGGIIHYDTGLYHAQSIRWLEEFGIVKGLGNLHSRLAYNSASFCLSALYSFSFLGKQSFHACAGFMAFLLAATCVEAFWSKKRGPERRLYLSDFIRILAVYYLLNIFDEMISPASDYFLVLTVFWILIRWLDLLEEEETSPIPYGCLCVLCVFAVTVKFSGAMLLLLTVKPALRLIREKKTGSVFLFLGSGILTIVPFLIRNVILSGWLLYPITFIDLFDLPYKIPKGMAAYDAKEIQVYGRGYTEVSRYGEPIAKWFPDWVKGLDTVNKIFLVLAAAAVVVFAIYLLYALFSGSRKMWDLLLVMFTFGAAFLFWLTSAPLIRYGCVFLWTFPALVLGFLYLKVTPGTDRYRLGMICLFFFCAYKAVFWGRELVQNAKAEHWIRQQDYDDFETESYELHGITFYYPKEGDRTGYRDFPSSPVKAEDIFLGNDIKDGFRDVVHQ